MNQPLRICFLFSTDGIGGSEKSMLRIMQTAHPHLMDCMVVFTGSQNVQFENALRKVNVPYSYCSNIRDFLKLCKQHHPDILYLFGRIRVIPWAIVARYLNIPGIIAAERSAASEWIDWVSRFFDQFVVNCYISNSQVAKRNLCNYVTLTRRPIFVVKNGIEPVETSEKDNCPLSSVNRPPRIICVANIKPLKGHIILLKAIKRLQSRYSEIKAVLVGQDFTEGHFFDEVDALDLANTYEWVGYTSNVYPYLTDADVFVLPSLYVEGTPTSILEAMQVGLPVVASDVGGVCEIVDHEHSGLLVPPSDVDALASALLQLLESPDKLVEMGHRGRDYVRSNHSIQSMVNNHLHIFSSIVNHPNKTNELNRVITE